MSRHFAVTVETSGERLVTIDSSLLSGKSDLTKEDEDTILEAAQHLIAFVGRAGCCKGLAPRQECKCWLDEQRS